MSEGREDISEFMNEWDGVYTERLSIDCCVMVLIMCVTLFALYLTTNDRSNDYFFTIQIIKAGTVDGMKPS